MPQGRAGGCVSRLVAGTAAVVVLLAGCSSPDPDLAPAPDPAPRPVATASAPAYANTGDRSERVADLPVLPTSSPEAKRVLYSQRIEVHEGSVLLAVAEFQTTNDLGLNVFVGSQVVLAASADATTGREITAANGENVTPAVHHGQQTKSGTYRAARTDAGVRYVNVVAWAASAAVAPGQRLAVDPGYGRLSVLQW